jgi:hypothetical protein
MSIADATYPTKLPTKVIVLRTRYLLRGTSILQGHRSGGRPLLPTGVSGAGGGYLRAPKLRPELGPRYWVPALVNVGILCRQQHEWAVGHRASNLQPGHRRFPHPPNPAGGGPGRGCGHIYSTICHPVIRLQYDLQHDSQRRVSAHSVPWIMDDDDEECKGLMAVGKPGSESPNIYIVAGMKCAEDIHAVRRRPHLSQYHAAPCFNSSPCTSQPTTSRQSRTMQLSMRTTGSWPQHWSNVGAYVVQQSL